MQKKNSNTKKTISSTKLILSYKNNHHVKITNFSTFSNELIVMILQTQDVSAGNTLIMLGC